MDRRSSQNRRRRQTRAPIVRFDPLARRTAPDRPTVNRALDDEPAEVDGAWAHIGDTKVALQTTQIRSQVRTRFKGPIAAPRYRTTRGPCTLQERRAPGSD